MNRLLVGRVLSLGLLVVLVLVALAACGGTEKEAKPRPLPEDDKALQPGEYRSEEFEPSLSFRVGDGWTNLPPESSEVLAIQRGAVVGEVNFFRLKEVYEPTRRSMPNLVEAPKDPKGWVAWVRHHPYLQTSEPEQVEVGGVKGLQVDVVVGDLPNYRGRCGTDCVDIGRVEGYPQLKIDVFMPEDAKARVTFLDVEGETVTISIISPASEFEVFEPEAQKVLESVEWRGS